MYMKGLADCLSSVDASEGHICIFCFSFRLSFSKKSLKTVSVHESKNTPSTLMLFFFFSLSSSCGISPFFFFESHSVFKPAFYP